MNWTHFLLWLAALYGSYYTAVLLSDMMRTGRKAAALGSNNELTFTEQVAPVELSVTEPMAVTAKPSSSSEMISSGGVPITDLFRLAKQEAILYTRSVSF